MLGQDELTDPHYGEAATLATVDRHLAELVEAIAAWEARDREQTAAYGLASRLCTVARNLTADAAQLARLSHIRQGRTRC